MRRRRPVGIEIGKEGEVLQSVLGRIRQNGAFPLRFGPASGRQRSVDLPLSGGAQRCGPQGRSAAFGRRLVGRPAEIQQYSGAGT